MKPEYENILNDRLSRKLALMLGSQKDWISIYALWCADNDVNWNTEAQEDHHINLFVKHAKADQRSALANGLTMATHLVLLACVGLLAAALHWPMGGEPAVSNRHTVAYPTEQEMRSSAQRYWDNYFRAAGYIYEHQVKPKKVAHPPHQVRLATK